MFVYATLWWFKIQTFNLANGNPYRIKWKNSINVLATVAYWYPVFRIRYSDKAADLVLLNRNTTKVLLIADSVRIIQVNWFDCVFVVVVVVKNNNRMVPIGCCFHYYFYLFYYNFASVSFCSCAIYLFFLNAFL